MTGSDLLAYLQKQSPETLAEEVTIADDEWFYHIVSVSHYGNAITLNVVNTEED